MEILKCTKNYQNFVFSKSFLSSEELFHANFQYSDEESLFGPTEILYLLHLKLRSIICMRNANEVFSLTSDLILDASGKQETNIPYGICCEKETGITTLLDISRNLTLWKCSLSFSNQSLDSQYSDVLVQEMEEYEPTFYTSKYWMEITTYHVCFDNFFNSLFEEILQDATEMGALETYMNFIPGEDITDEDITDFVDDYMGSFTINTLIEDAFIKKIEGARLLFLKIVNSTFSSTSNITDEKLLQLIDENAISSFKFFEYSESDGLYHHFTINSLLLPFRKFMASNPLLNEQESAMANAILEEVQKGITEETSNCSSLCCYEFAYSDIAYTDSYLVVTETIGWNSNGDASHQADYLLEHQYFRSFSDSFILYLNQKFHFLPEWLV